LPYAAAKVLINPKTAGLLDSAGMSTFDEIARGLATGGRRAAAASSTGLLQ